MAGAKQACLGKLGDEISAVREGRMDGDLKVWVMVLAYL